MTAGSWPIQLRWRWNQMRKIKTVRTQKKRSGSRLSSLGYLLKEGVKNIWSNRTMSFASVGVLVSCLLLTGAAVLFSMNVDVAMKSLEGNNSTTVYPVSYTHLDVYKRQILDNILPGDIYLKARELRFNSDVSRVCMLIKITNKSDISAYDVIQNLFPDKSKDFIININETDIALVKEIGAGIEPKDLEKLAGSIVDTLSSEFYTHCVVGIGTIVAVSYTHLDVYKRQIRF